MKRSSIVVSAATLAVALMPVALAQEAGYGLDVPVSASFFMAHTRRGMPARGGSTVTPGFRAVIYPSLKLGEHWFSFAAVQLHSTPYFYEELGSPRRELKVDVLQAYVGYSRAVDGKSLTLKAGQLTSAFGSFPLRYDDAGNWLIDLPQSYGYYYFPVTVHGMPGVEADAVVKNADFRAQFTNSSPSNPRKLWQSDQYGTWTVGGGYRIRPSLRVGASAMRGAYLHRGHRYFFPGEAPPRTLPATGFGLDVQFAKGRWNVNAEAQRFQYAYIAIPYFFNTLGYAEVKFTVNSRWYMAGRAGTRWRSGGLKHDESYELAAAYRPGKGHLVKIGYLALDGPFSPGARDNVVGIQYVVSLRPPPATWD